MNEDFTQIEDMDYCNLHLEELSLLIQARGIIAKGYKDVFETYPGKFRGPTTYEIMGHLCSAIERLEEAKTMLFKSRQLSGL